MRDGILANVADDSFDFGAVSDSPSSLIRNRHSIVHYASDARVLDTLPGLSGVRSLYSNVTSLYTIPYAMQYRNQSVSCIM